MEDCWPGCWTGEPTGRHLVNGGGDRSCSLGLVLGEDKEGAEEGLDVNLCWLTGNTPPTTQGLRSEVIMGVMT